MSLILLVKHCLFEGNQLPIKLNDNPPLWLNSYWLTTGRNSSATWQKHRAKWFATASISTKTVLPRCYIMKMHQLIHYTLQCTANYNERFGFEKTQFLILSFTIATKVQNVKVIVA